MKYLASILAGLFLAGTSWAQDIDESRMERDIKIAEDIISGLLTQGEGHSKNFFGKSNVSGNYVRDYGVIFNIPTKKGMWPLGIKIMDDDGKIVITDQARGTTYEVEDKDYLAYGGSGYHDLIEMGDDYLETAMETFLVDYADLIGQLKPTDKIMLKSENKQGGVFVVGGDQSYAFSWKYKDHDEDEDEDEEEDEDEDEDEEGCCEDYDGGDYVLSAEVTKGDLSSFKSGKINRDQLVERIQFEKTESTTKSEPELELLSTIFRRLYKSDLSDTYFASRDPDYDRIVKFGVIYKWRVYSSNVDGNKHNMPTVDLYDLTSDERNRKVEELYPKFKEQFRQNLVEYGRTLKGLEPDDILMFKIKMTECEGCTIPKNVDFSVKRSVLDDYEKQKIDLKTASSKVSVNEKMTD